MGVSCVCNNHTGLVPLAAHPHSKLVHELQLSKETLFISGVSWVLGYTLDQVGVELGKAAVQERWRDQRRVSFGSCNALKVLLQCAACVLALFCTCRVQNGVHKLFNIGI